MTLREDRFQGCLLAAAIGDALGQPIEAFPPERLRQEFGEIRDFMAGDPRLPVPMAAGQWTDDTQLTLDVVTSLLRAGRLDPDDLAHEFVRDHWDEGLRFSGFTVKFSLLRLKNGVPWQESGLGDEKCQGNRAAMRAAPIGLLDCLHLDRLPADVELASIITHRHPESIVGAIAIAYMVARAVTGTLDPGTILAETIDVIGECRVADNLSKAQQILAAGTETSEALKQIGTTGWIVHTTAAAAYCFLKTPDDLERTIINAVMGGNDADTTATIAGAISGAYNGVAAIPSRWRDHVERGEEIVARAGDLWRLVVNAG